MGVVMGVGDRMYIRRESQSSARIIHHSIVHIHHQKIQQQLSVDYHSH